MSYDNDQNEFPLPAADGKKNTSAINFLPKFFRTDTNKKFISSTIDQMINPGVIEKVNAFAGRRYSRATTINDTYLPDFTKSREDYQFEPVAVYKDDLSNVKFLKNYNDYIGQISNFKGNVSNHSLLNSQEFYAWNPNIDWDKFVNFREYYWLPMGPDPVGILGQVKDVVSTFTVELGLDEDNYAYVFTPNGFTRNPTLKLYKDTVYRFEINTPGHPFGITINREFVDNNLDYGVDGDNISSLYTKGIKRYKYDAEGKLVETADYYIENGVIEFTVPVDVPDLLYYVSQNNINTNGIILNYSIEENSEINVEEEVLGKKTYTLSNGTVLSNGMKVHFFGKTMPAKYAEGYWYVEGVGTAIKLVAETDLQVPAIFSDSIEIPFDAYGWDQYPFEDASAFPGTKDYIVVNRSSADRNPWTRYNRWFHKDVIEKSAEFNNLDISLNQDARAKRPIIEFNAGLKLYKHGSKTKQDVTLVDTFTPDVFSTIEGSLGYNVDGVDLIDGMRVLFTADTDILVKNKIYEVKFITHNGRRQISLIESADAIPELDDCVLVLQGTEYKGKMFYYDGSTYKQSQDKTTINQAPLFDLFDYDGHSYSDTTIFPASDFAGNKIFSYAEGTGTADSELGFPLKYRNISNVGDIVFDFNLSQGFVSYQSGFHEGGTENFDTSFVRIYNNLGTEFVYENGWKKANTLSQQAVLRQYNIEDVNQKIIVDVFDNSALVEDLVVKVYVNNTLQYNTVDYAKVNVNNVIHIQFNNSLNVGDIVLLKCYSSQSKNSNGLYEIPSNFEKNPLNENIDTFTLGEVNEHVKSIVENHPEFSGIFPGIGNIRDIGNQSEYGRKFLQHSGPLNLALYHLTDKAANVIKALRYARLEYAKFKRKFLYEADKTGFHGTTKDHVDLIMSTITKDIVSNRPYYFSDMIGIGAATKTLHTIEYPGAAYFAISSNFNLTTLSTKAITVYRNGEQLLYQRDYTIADNFVYVSLNLQADDIIEIYEYESTNGSYIPPTPTKLGLYPKYQPMILKDSTSTVSNTFEASSNDISNLLSFIISDVHPLVTNFDIKVYVKDPDAVNFIQQSNDFFTVQSIPGNFRRITLTGQVPLGSIVDIRYPAVMIQGHDGSLTRVFADYRDDLILDLENRIYNNIKCHYDTDKLDIHDFIGSKDRNTNFSKSDIDNILLADFAQWLEVAGNPNYSGLNFWDKENTFTYNYSNMTGPDTTQLTGYWRSIYNEYYDTDRPHSHPWEMLGFSIKPTWWDSVYGPAPYTRNNGILWRDLSEGIIREPGTPVQRNKKYIRSYLLENIPVDDYGRLISPLESGLAKDFNLSTTTDNFIFGDQAPVETAWRRSSEYPFSLITAWCLLQPTKIIGIGFDISRIQRNIAGNLIYTETNKSIQTSSLLFPSISTDESLVLTSGLSTYISNYMVNGIRENYNLYQEKLTRLTNQLAIKLGGFADKSKLKLVLDSRSPLNKTSVFVPDENYQIILSSSNVLETAIFSGIIVEKTTDGYMISGYDKESSVFYYNKPIVQQNDISITVGGISEQFTVWSEEKQYVSGFIVSYDNRYYRTKITHVSGTEFDSTKFAVIASLPIVGGQTAQLRKQFESTVSQIPYGTIFKSVQEVVDFMEGYETYLKNLGFKFDYFNSETEALEDMTLCIKEFMFWVTQNWDTGTVITLSPVANKLEFEKPYYIVDDVFDPFYEYNLLSGSGTKISREFSNIYRDNSNQFIVTPTNSEDGIFLMKLPLVQKEHVVLVDNETVFSDVIYQLSTGYRQDRIKLVGYRTDEWNGGLNIPGFVYDKAEVLAWGTYSDYSVGDVVKYKEFYYSANQKHSSDDYFDANLWNRLDERPEPQLLPNWDYKALQFTDFYDLDTDNFDTEQQRLGQHLIGYQPREYLANIINDTTSQYKFYQGFIQDKGTLNSLTKLFDALSSSEKDSLEFYEEWAIRLGRYGATENVSEIEYQLDESLYRLEPQLFDLVDYKNNTRTDLVYEIAKHEPYLKPFDYNHQPFETVNDNKIYAVDNGYVNLDHVSYVVDTYDNIVNINIDTIAVGNFIWVINEKQDWNVYKISQIDEDIVSFSLGLPAGAQIDENNNILTGFTAYFPGYVDFEVDDIIGIKADGLVNGFYKINHVSYNSDSVALTEVGFLTSIEITDETDFPSTSSLGILKLSKRRFTDVLDANTNILDLISEISDTVWIDDKGDGNWAVYQNSDIFKLLEETTNPTNDFDGFATSFAIDKSNTTIVIGSPDDDNGTIRIYNRFSENSEKTLFQQLLSDSDTVDPLSKYGFSVAISTDSKYIAVGAPNVSNAQSKFRGQLGGSESVDSTNYAVGDIIEDRGILWRAVNEVSTDGSTITVDSQDWETALLIEIDTTGTVSGLTNQGAVYIYEKTVNNTYTLKHQILSPTPTENEYFGYSVELRNTADGTTKLFVGAPGNGNTTGRIYFIDNFDADWKYSLDRNYKGIFGTGIIYNTNDIVHYEGTLYKADTRITAGSAIPGVSPLWIELSNDDTDATNNFSEYTGYIPRGNAAYTADGENSIEENYTRIGEKFDVNALGDILLLAAPHTTNRKQRAFVYRNVDSRWQFSQYIDTDNIYEDFGYAIAIDDVGEKIAISAPTNDTVRDDGGCVYVYNQVTVAGVPEYQLEQTLRSPFNEKNEAFGIGVDFSSNKLAIAAKNTDRLVITSFDFYTEILEDSPNLKIYDPTSARSDSATTFDGNTTKFINKTEDVGRIVLFQKIGDNYLFGEDIAYNRNIKYNDVSNFVLNNNHLYIGLPKFNPASVDENGLENYYQTVDSTLGVFVDVRSASNSNSWNALAEQTDKARTDKINRCFIYSKVTDDILINMDILDPRQGKIPGPADQEISWKTFYDPAVYSINRTNAAGNTAEVIVDDASNWTDKYVGKLWWDLSTASWYNPYQGSIQYRSSVWNKLIPGSTIDVYEWVGSIYLPSQWNALADTNQGLVNDISGRPLYDDSVYSVKRVYDEVSKQFVERYFYWVKSKKTIPINSNRILTAFQVENLIADPAGQGYRFATILGSNQFALYNVKSTIESTNSILHFTFTKDVDLKTNVHNEYQLMTEGLGTSRLNSEIEQKWIDSLVGYDLNYKAVPDTSLSAKQKYGILNTPRQSMFVNRIEAVKQLIERINSVLILNQIVDNYDISNLLTYDEAPSTSSGEYDLVVDTVPDLDYLGVAKVEQAVLEPIIENTRIVGINIVNPGNNYRRAPSVYINDSIGSGAKITTTINAQGQVTSTYIRSQGKNYTPSTTVSVRKFSALVNADSEINGRWSVYEWNKLTQEWSRRITQNFNTSNYWNYADWYATGYNNLTPIDFVVDQSYQLFSLSDDIGNVVKINNIGAGGWLLLRKVDDQLVEDYTVNYETIGRQNGTIQLLSRLYDYTTKTSGYDANIYDTAFYDREPIIELRTILASLRDDIFIGDLAAEWNKLFFSSVRYAMYEQPTVDWVFKTSFVTAKHNVGDLEQKVTFQNDNLENYQDYVNEVKPYSTKVREYVSSYTYTQPTQSLVTDFDLPPSYNINTLDIEASNASMFNNTVINLYEKYQNYPYKSWVDNNGYDVIRIDIADSGSGYIDTPLVTVAGNNGTTAKAYLSRGRISSIEIFNTGGKYYSAPEIIIDGNIAQGGTPAKAVAILGNGVVRSSHIAIKFDRVSGNYFITDINETETFTGTAVTEVFKLKWPMNVKTTAYTVTVNGVTQLSSAYSVGNSLDTTKSYDRYIGYIEFAVAPPSGSVISVTYQKDIKMLDAADRINFFYNPTTGMAGRDLSQLMDGVEYTGAVYDSINFGTEQGFGTGGFAEYPWDTFENNVDDEIFTLDGSTAVFELSQPLENGIEYNFYLNGVRLDDPEYDATTVLANENAKMATIIGDGVTTTITIDMELIPTTANDVVVIRKSTSDGSLSLTYTSYDTALSGGNLAYTTATGIAAEDITVDGDGFVTPTTSKGPEELVPGQVMDVLDIKVYHKLTDGVGIIGVANYVIDGSTNVFDLPSIPQTNDSVFIKVDNVLQTNVSYSIDYNAQTIELADSTLPINSLLSIVTIGTNGVNYIDTEIKIFDGSTLSYTTAAVWEDEITTFVTVNGVVKEVSLDYNVLRTEANEEYPNRVKIVFESNVLTDGDVIQYSIYNTAIISYSQTVIDRTFVSNDVNNYHKFEGDIPVPFNNGPLASNVLVKVNNQILNPGYNVGYVTTDSRNYNIERWQFADLESISESEIFVFSEGVQLTREDYTYNPVDSRIEILRPTVAPSGSNLQIYIIKNAEYYFVDTQITFDTATNLTTFVEAGDSIELLSSSGVTYSYIIETVNADNIIVRSWDPAIREAFVANDEFTVTINEGDSTLLNITDVSFIASDNLTFVVPPAVNSEVEIYQFSNHDVNNFQRIKYDVLTTTSVTLDSDDYITRNLLTRGIIELRNDILENQYAWVIKNGTLLTPNVDYIVNSNLNAVQLKSTLSENDTIDIVHTGAPPVNEKFGFRIFKDILNRTHYKRLNENNSYVLASPLNYYDSSILLDSTDGIFQPNKDRNVPGVVFIEGERIEYFEVIGNRLRQLRRGTLGTGIKNIYEPGVKLYGQGPEENINYKDTTSRQIFVADGTSSEYTLDFTPSSINDVEVFLGGRRLRKTNIDVFDPTINQDSPEGDNVISPEFRIDGVNLYIEPRNRITNDIVEPSVFEGQRIEVVRKTGKVWNETGKSLKDTNNEISRFLRAATIQLPK